MTSNLALIDDDLDALPDDLLDELPRRRGPIEIVTSRVQRQARPRMIYALIATAALFVLLLTQLGMSIALSQGAYKISSLQSTQTTLNRSQEKYSEKLKVLSSQQNIANNATALGMVRNQNPVYLDLSTETVYGTPTAAAGTAATADNLIPNSLLKGVPVVAKTKADAAKAAAAKVAAAKTAAAKAAGSGTSTGSASSTTGAADQKTPDGSVPSGSNQLAAPQTR